MKSPQSASTGCATSPLRCCFPMAGLFGKQRRARNAKRSVRFTSGIASQHLATPVLSKRSPSRSSYYSAVSALSRIHDLEDDMETRSGDSCICEHPAHNVYDPKFPLVVCPSWTGPGCYEEFLAHAEAVVGKWVTVLERSESLDPQMTYIGVNKMKRMVMNRLAVPLEAVLDEEKRTLKLWIETPLGNKYTHASLVGEELEDKDGDLGDWTSKTVMVNYSTPQYCGGTSVRAMQLERSNPKLGMAFETRAILPDPEFGSVLLYNITIRPPSGVNPINVTRIYKRRS